MQHSFAGHDCASGGQPESGNGAFYAFNLGVQMPKFINSSSNCARHSLGLQVGLNIAAAKARLALVQLLLQDCHLHGT